MAKYVRVPLPPANQYPTIFVAIPGQFASSQLSPTEDTSNPIVFPQQTSLGEIPPRPSGRCATQQMHSSTTQMSRTVLIRRTPRISFRSGCWPPSPPFHRPPFLFSEQISSQANDVARSQGAGKQAI